MPRLNFLLPARIDLTKKIKMGGKMRLNNNSSVDRQHSPITVTPFCLTVGQAKRVPEATTFDQLLVE